MSFFSENETRSLQIENMILHVVGGKDFTPESKRKVEHSQFFIRRIVEADAQPIYSFDARSTTKLMLEQIASGRLEFEQGAQDLSREFSRLHVGGSIDGALFIFELTCDEPGTKFYCLIKYDYREAIEQSEQDGESLLRKIVHAFIDDKKAIQKAAIVRVKGGTADLSVATKDRAKTAPAIGDYFAKFLNVNRTLSDTELTANAVQALKLAITECKQYLPDQDVPKAFRVAKAILRGRAEIGEDAIVEAVQAAAENPVDEAIASAIKDISLRKIKGARLTGLSFKPDRQLLGRPPVRRIKTIEGVVLTYPDALEAASVERKAGKDGSEVIVITTKKIVEDKVVANSAS